MKAEKTKLLEETLPDFEIIRREKDVEIRVNFKLIPSIKTDFENKPESFSYDYFLLKKMTISNLKQAVIKEKYPSYNEEFAAINSKESNPEKYQAYQDRRKYADDIVNIIFNE